MMVLFSLLIEMRLAVPRSFRVAVSEAQTHFFRDHGAASQNGDVLQHGLATVAEARTL